MRRVVSFVLALAGLIVACHGGRARVPEPQHAQSRARVGGRCPASGIHSSGTCPTIHVPSVNASSPEGCHSDADCSGLDGRCIENPSYDPRFDRSDRARLDLGRGLLGEAPRPPAPTTCVSDACHSDDDCQRGWGCECGSGEGADRNRCILLDACLADADCKSGQRCECDRDGPNYCLASNCDSDAECAGLACSTAHSGRFCHTKGDRCARDADCTTTKPGWSSRCDYDVAATTWQCVDEPPPPPG